MVGECVGAWLATHRHMLTPNRRAGRGTDYGGASPSRPEYCELAEGRDAGYGVAKDELDLTEAEKEEFAWDDMPAVYFPVEITYATVHKERDQGRVVGEVRGVGVLSRAGRRV